jgi:hypothetical protein
MMCQERGGRCQERQTRGVRRGDGGFKKEGKDVKKGEDHRQHRGRRKQDNGSVSGRMRGQEN